MTGGGVTDGDPAVDDRGVAGAMTTTPATRGGRTSDAGKREIDWLPVISGRRFKASGPETLRRIRPRALKASEWLLGAFRPPSQVKMAATSPGDEV